MPSLLKPIENFNLPSEVIRVLRSRGIRYFTPPQAEALRRGVLEFKNMLVTAPTASGKTLIAELALANAYLRGMKVIYATPLKTLASEKYEEFSLWYDIGVKVGISTGDFDEPGEWLGRYDVVVATYERLDSIFRLKPSWLKDVGVIIIDEFHTIGDTDRGPIVELLAVRALREGKQLIGLSATVGNPGELAEWLNAELVVSDWRPVRLIEGYYNKRKKKIFFEDGREEEVSGSLLDYVAVRALRENYQVLIFRQSRSRAEETAKKLTRLMPESLGYYDLVEKLKSRGAPNSEVSALAQLFRRGISFHHAGLSFASRRTIEEGFRAGFLRVVVATPTLAAGINMPARRVIIYTRRYESGYMKPISIAEYKQMAGRAGRPQYDPYGEAVVADARSEEEGWRYVKGVPEDVKSALVNARAMRIHTLSLIASGYVANMRELMEVMESTLAFKQLASLLSDEAIEYTIDQLVSMEMVKIEREHLKATPLGSYVSKLYIDPLTALVIIDDLKKQQNVPNIYYLVLIAMTPDFERVRITKYRTLAEEMEAALDNGEIPEPRFGLDYYDLLRAYKAGRILHAWIEEVDEDQILERFGVGAGDLHNIVETASWLVYAASRVCHIYGLRQHSRRLNVLAHRVKHGVKEDALDLVRVRGIGRVRARILIMNNIRSLEDLAAADPLRISKLPTFGETLAREIVKEARELVRKTAT